MSWSKVGSDIKGSSAGDWAGQNVSISKNGKVIAIGSPGNTNNSHNGKVKICIEKVKKMFKTFY